MVKSGIPDWELVGYVVGTFVAPPSNVKLMAAELLRWRRKKKKSAVNAKKKMQARG